MGVDFERAKLIKSYSILTAQCCQCFFGNRNSKLKFIYNLAGSSIQKCLENMYSFHEIVEIWEVVFLRGGGGGVVFEIIEIFCVGGEAAARRLVIFFGKVRLEFGGGVGEIFLFVFVFILMFRLVLRCCIIAEHQSAKLRK